MKKSKFKSFLAVMVCPGALPLGSIREATDDCGKDAENVRDSQISKKVERVLSTDTEHAYASVQVATHQGIVRLDGGVSTPDQKRHASELAYGVNGVKKVQNYITVKDLFRYYLHHLFSGLHRSH